MPSAILLVILAASPALAPRGQAVDEVPARAADAPTERATRAPNFVVLLADDLGWNDVGYHGGDYPTPVLDRLAQTGTRLECFYVQPLCSPTRAALLTGRYPIRYGLQSCALRPWADAGLPTTERTLADALRDAGYRTAIVGKWHLGHHDRAYLPTRRGFDHQYGPYNGGVHYVTHKRLGRLDWHRDDAPLEEEGYATTLLAREAVRLVNRHDFDAAPLFLYVPFTAVHSPRSAPAPLVARFEHLEPESRRVYAAMVASLDGAVGDILDALQKRGVRDNTLVLFGSDNGGAPGLGDNTPLSGFKGDFLEGGVRASWIASWPTRVPPGAIVERPLHVVDLFPTLLALAGVPVEPGDRGERLPLDGIDIGDVLFGEDRPATERELLLYSGPRGGALRLGDLKLVLESQGDGEPRVSLFDVAADRTEEHDLALLRPDDVRRLRARLDVWESVAVPPLRLPAERPKDFVPPAVWGQGE
jgi:arylsulfatase A-like enzyme